MDTESVDHWIEQVRVGITDPEFAPRLFQVMAREETAALLDKPDGLALCVRAQYVDISMQMDRAALQESCSYRSSQRALLLAAMLIDEQGALKERELNRALILLEEALYSLGPGRHVDEVRMKHQLRVLGWLKTDSEVRMLFLRLDKPFFGGWIDGLIRETLHLEASRLLKVADIRRAVLAAHLTYLRQNVGSCFATAPASLIHRQQPTQFLRDIESLVTMGKLTRVIAGVEHAVPISRSSGVGELMKPIFFASDPSDLASSPALQAAFKAAQLIDGEEELFARSHEILKSIQKELQGTIWSSAGQIIRVALLQELDLTEERVRMASRATPFFNPPNSRAVESFKERERAACAVFKRQTDNALLKTWEFTLASFAESKADFAKWNFYVSLGLPTDQKGGIGACIYASLQEKLDELNRELESLRAKYDILYGAARFAEGRARSASESEMRWLQLEYRQKVAELESVENEMRAIANRASSLASLPPKLVNFYLEHFPGYFQEVYDAEMQDVKASPFDDSPAGFRLLYKHGRSSPAAWSLIHGQEEFIASLTDFFTATERQVVEEVSGEALEREMGELVTRIVSHVRNEEFLLSALVRMANAYGAALPSNPLQQLEKVEKKPWAYISGGTMTTLVANYYARESEPSLSERVTESALDLALFLLDLFKDMPSHITERFVKDPTRSLLVQSPTHGFQLKPGLRPFVDGWLDRGNTYTWLRDRIIIPQRDAYHQMELRREQMRYLLAAFETKLPFKLQYSFRHTFRHLPREHMSVLSFRHHVVDEMRYQRWFGLVAQQLAVEEELDGLLYTKLPLTEGRLVRDAVERVFSLMDEPLCPVDAVLKAFDRAAGRYLGVELVSADQLQQICQAMAMLVTGRVAVASGLPGKIRQAMRRGALATPQPLIFADSNWVTDLFAFLVNPGTEELELWRVEEHGLVGYPMSRWRQYLSPQNTKPWCVYSRPFEYER